MDPRVHPPIVPAPARWISPPPTFAVTFGMPIHVVAIDLALGLLAGHVAARFMRGHLARRALLLVLTLTAAITMLAGVSAYDAGLQQALYIARVDMAALGFDVLLGVLAVATAVVVAGRNGGWIPARPLAFRYQDLVNAPLTAFIAGILTYLIVYPPTTWAFRVAVPLTAVLGILLALPLPAPDALRLAALLQALAGLAAVLAGLATNAPVFMLLGGFLLGAGLTQVRRLGRERSLTLGRMLGIAFGAAPSTRPW